MSDTNLSLTVTLVKILSLTVIVLVVLNHGVRLVELAVTNIKPRKNDFRSYALYSAIVVGLVLFLMYANEEAIRRALALFIILTIFTLASTLQVRRVRTLFST